MLVEESSPTILPPSLLSILNTLKYEVCDMCVFKKHDLIVSALCVMLKECDILPVLKCRSEVAASRKFDDIYDATLSSLPKVWRNNETGHYNLSLVLNDFIESDIKFIAIPTGSSLIVNLVVCSLTTRCYSVCVDCDKYINCCIVLWDSVASVYKNLKDLSLHFKNNIAHPARSLILNDKGIVNASLLGIPPEIQLKILSHLSIEDLGYLSQTCSYFYYLCNDQKLWKNIVKPMMEKRVFLAWLDVPEAVNWKLLCKTYRMGKPHLYAGFFHSKANMVS